MSSGQPEEVVGPRDMARTIAYMALGVALAAVILLGVYVFRSTRPIPIIKELQTAQVATAEDLHELERAVEDLSVTVSSIEESARRDRQASVVLDLQRSLITIKEMRKEAPASLRPKTKAIEDHLVRLLDEMGSPTPKQRIEIRSVR
ncbi:hypothetical protein MYX64_01395 [Nitrospinae bacterium AH_259_B05_G02_I21]|nr:hypothetical protein [Nitrospinae bacterium AH_259_B05_G02_I21]